MTTQQFNRRVAAVKTADAINAIEGAPVSDYARMLSLSWAKGEITGEQMKSALMSFHRKVCITGTPKWLIYTCMTMCLFSVIR